MTSEEVNLVEWLDVLSSLNKLQWKEVHPGHGLCRYEADYKGFHFFIDHWFDKSPTLCITNPAGNKEVVSGYQIKSLIRTVQEQCETPEKIAKREADKQEAKKLLLDSAKKKNDFVVEVLKALKE